MSATLTWAFSGYGTKTNTTVGAFFDDLDTLVTSFSANTSFTWQTAGKNSSATSPQYIVLSRKGGAAGRILIVVWSSAPAGNNTAILDQAPFAGTIYIAWFPNGTANTPSNLTSGSGTIMGNDTNCIKVCPCNTISTAYAAGCQSFFFDSAEAWGFGIQNPGATQVYGGVAGLVVVDAADVVYDAVVGSGLSSINSMGGAGTWLWTATAQLAGGTNPVIRSNYGAANRTYFQAWIPSAGWGTQVVGPNDILTDTSISESWYVPVQLLSQVKGDGFKIKLRQIAAGHATTGAFAVENTTGPTVATRCFNGNTIGGNTGNPWFTNFKL